MSALADLRENKRLIAKSARRAISSLRGLEKTLLYLRAELEAEMEGQAPPTFLVDWDVIQMFAEFRLVRSIYAASILKGFEKAAEHKIRLVVPQGTRMEFVKYTSGLARILRLPSEDSMHTEGAALEGAYEGVYRDRRYDRQRLKLSRARHISEVAGLLDKFCQRYGESLALLPDGSFTEMPMRELEGTPFFQKALDDVYSMREEGTLRNKADAANIAVLDMAEHVGKKYMLVSGTTMLSKLRPGKIVDPVSFLLRLHLATPQRRRRSAALSHLEHLHAHVLKLMERSTTVLDGVEGETPYITRRQAEDWIDHLRDMESDTTIGTTIRLITATHLDAENRRTLLRENIAVGESWSMVEHLSQVRNAVSHLGGIIASMYPEGGPLEDLGYRWSGLRVVNGFREKQLLSSQGQVVLEIAASNKICVCSWLTSCKLMDFLRLVHSRLESEDITGGGMCSIRLYYRDRPTRVLPLDRLSILQLSAGTRSIRPDSFRVFGAEFNLVYEISEEPGVLPKFIVIVDIERKGIISSLFQETFAEFIPAPVVVRELDALLGQAVKAEANDA